MSVNLLRLLLATCDLPSGDPKPIPLCRNLTFLDLAADENYLAGKLEDLDLAQGKIDAALGDLPKA